MPRVSQTLEIKECPLSDRMRGAGSAILEPTEQYKVKPSIKPPESRRSMPGSERNS
jgi:hypothetical protein